jgi:hypothetical protein
VLRGLTLTHVSLPVFPRARACVICVMRRADRPGVGWCAGSGRVDSLSSSIDGDFVDGFLAVSVSKESRRVFISLMSKHAGPA